MQRFTATKQKVFSDLFHAEVENPNYQVLKGVNEKPNDSLLKEPGSIRIFEFKYKINCFHEFQQFKRSCRLTMGWYKDGIYHQTIIHKMISYLTKNTFARLKINNSELKRRYWEKGRKCLDEFFQNHFNCIFWCTLVDDTILKDKDIHIQTQSSYIERNVFPDFMFGEEEDVEGEEPDQILFKKVENFDVHDMFLEENETELSKLIYKDRITSKKYKGKEKLKAAKDLLYHPKLELSSAFILTQSKWGYTEMNIALAKTDTLYALIIWDLDNETCEGLMINLYIEICATLEKLWKKMKNAPKVELLKANYLLKYPDNDIGEVPNPYDSDSDASDADSL